MEFVIRVCLVVAFFNIHMQQNLVRWSMISSRESGRERLEGSMLAVCTDCRSMVLQVRRLRMMGLCKFSAGDPVTGEEQEVQKRSKEGGVWPLENICNTFSSTCNTCTASSNIS